MYVMSKNRLDHLRRRRDFFIDLIQTRLGYFKAKAFDFDIQVSFQNSSRVNYHRKLECLIYSFKLSDNIKV